MAISFEGKTKCPICGKVIESEEDAVSFPAFLGKNHPLHRFSDNIFHRHCFEADADGESVEQLYAKYRAIWDARPLDLKTKEEIEDWGRSAFSEFH